MFKHAIRLNRTTLHYNTNNQKTDRLGIIETRKGRWRRPPAKKTYPGITLSGPAGRPAIDNSFSVRFNSPEYFTNLPVKHTRKTSSPSISDRLVKKDPMFIKNQRGQAAKLIHAGPLHIREPTINSNSQRPDGSPYELPSMPVHFFCFKSCTKGTLAG